jgi:hypothetical protein
MQAPLLSQLAAPHWTSEVSHMLEQQKVPRHCPEAQAEPAGLVLVAPQVAPAISTGTHWPQAQ